MAEAFPLLASRCKKSRLTTAAGNSILLSVAAHARRRALQVAAAATMASKLSGMQSSRMSSCMSVSRNGVSLAARDRVRIMRQAELCEGVPNGKIRNMFGEYVRGWMQKIPKEVRGGVGRGGVEAFHSLLGS